MATNVLIMTICFSGIAFGFLMLGLFVLLYKYFPPKDTAAYMQLQIKKQKKEKQKANINYLKTAAGKKFLKNVDKTCEKLLKEVDARAKKGMPVYGGTFDIKKFGDKKELLENKLSNYFSSRGYYMNLQFGKDTAYILLSW